MSDDRIRYRGPEDAVRLGMPSRPLSDLYFQMMRGSWWGLIGLFVGFYLLANLAFAGLYMIDARGIASGEGDDFATAFFFSVQTISTIGYGSLSPTTPYANMLVTAEAMVGLLGFAMATGLMFTKFAKPRAGVMFSSRMVVTNRNGCPCLMLRVANARGNEVVEAHIRVAVLLREETPEGHNMRRLYDLPLVRDNSPLFSLSWSVMHMIDDKSPLAGFDHDEMMESQAAFILTLTGHDSTFAQMVHARHMYMPEDIEFGKRFVDVIGTTDDHRLLIDYRKFHDIEADPTWSGT